jgi:hypothetical protein
MYRVMQPEEWTATPAVSRHKVIRTAAAIPRLTSKLRAFYATRTFITDNHSTLY